MTIRVYVLPEVRELARSKVQELNEMADWQIDVIREQYGLGLHADRKEVIEWMMQFRVKDYYTPEMEETAFLTPWADLAYDIEVEDHVPVRDWGDEIYELEMGVRW